MTIGVITYWTTEGNYGTILQCYALQKFLGDIGHDVYLIRYDLKLDDDVVKNTRKAFFNKCLKILNLNLLWHYLFSKYLMMVNLKNEKKHPREFSNFKNKHIKYTKRIYSYEDLVNDPPFADVYIAGSDQVWNFFDLPLSKIKNRLHAHFLDFGKKETIRFAYAASFGSQTLKKDYIQEISELLQRFNYISVREKSGIDICEQCGIRNVKWRPDPTALLDVDTYRLLYKNESIEKQEKPYCFVYILGNSIDLRIKDIFEWINKKKLNIVYVTANFLYDRYKKFYATIPEWLYLIDNAEYVITNSFHGFLFSLIFQKKFGIIPLTNDFYAWNDRFDSLFEYFKIEKRFVDQKFNILDKSINWECVVNKLEEIRINAKEWFNFCNFQ
jgi:hypothetical protein